ncbi:MULTISPECIES: SPOR domain-containing protein [Methylotenera]|uniref:SPOR domain-containing protein n=1 Tax=Methylotenera TaxID=359407 RepID=UPI000374886C|nr:MULTISPECIES: SPOR domain-containing protein [Methylotenera]
MSKDYKPAAKRNGTSSKGNPFFTGLLVGILLGVGLSVGLTMYIKGTDSPFNEKKISQPNKDTLAEKLPKQKIATDNALPSEENPDDSAAKKTDNQFDFYTILPETESTVTEKEIKDRALTVKKDNYFLQVGAFPNEADADNMKAKLALQGFEAVVQTATIPEKGVWHRVRVGPLSDIDQINKIRGDLTTAGFNTDLIKVHTETKPQ